MDRDDQTSYVHTVCGHLVEALKRLPWLYLEGPQIRRRCIQKALHGPPRTNN